MNISYILYTIKGDEVENMDINLIKDLYDLHVNGFENAFGNVYKNKKYDFVFNNSIKDCYDNFISNFDVNNLKEFQSFINEISKEFKNVNRKMILYVLPFMNECYQSREKYFSKDQFEIVSKESWQIYTDYKMINNIKTNCPYNVELQLADNMENYASYMLDCFKSDNKDDPYGDIDEGYGKAYANFQSRYDNIKCNAYYIKANGNIVGVSQSVSNNKYYGIYGLAIKEEYRKKGIGKKSLLQHLKKCKESGIKLAFLQTEKDYYPYEIYKSMGFKDLFTAYYYLKKDE